MNQILSIEKIRETYETIEDEQPTSAQTISLEKLSELFQLIDNQPIGKLSELAKIAGLNLAEDYIGADLSGEDLSRDNLNNANLSNANLSNTNMSDVYLNDANLSGANLSGANLISASLCRANLSYGDLSDANLSGADLSGANLSHANLCRANLTNTNLSNVDLSHVDLRGTLMTASSELSQKEILDLKERGAIIEGVTVSSDRNLLFKNAYNKYMTSGIIQLKKSSSNLAIFINESDDFEIVWQKSQADSKSEELRKLIEANPDNIFTKEHIQDKPNANFQLIILNRVWKNKTWEEIADIMQISSTQTLSSFYNRCLKQFRHFFREYLHN